MERAQFSPQGETEQSGISLNDAAGSGAEPQRGPGARPRARNPLCREAASRTITLGFAQTQQGRRPLHPRSLLKKAGETFFLRFAPSSFNPGLVKEDKDTPSKP